MRIWRNKRLSHHLQVSDTLRSVTYSSTPFLVDNPEITSRSLANVRAVSANAQTQQRNVRGKLTVSRGSSIIIGMHPDVRRDLPLFRELDHVHRRGAGAKARYVEQIVGAMR